MTDIEIAKLAVQLVDHMRKLCCLMNPHVWVSMTDEMPRIFLCKDCHNKFIENNPHAIEINFRDDPYG